MGFYPQGNEDSGWTVESPLLSLPCKESSMLNFGTSPLKVTHNLSGQG